MKKLLLITLVFISFIPCVSADLGYTELEYTTSTICDYDYNCYPVYHIVASGREAFFLNYSQNFNLFFSHYYEVDIKDTKLPIQVLEYASITPYLKANGIYYKEVMTKKLWELIYGGYFEISNPQNMEVLRQINDFDTILERAKTPPSFTQKTYSITNDENIIIEDETLNEYEIKETPGLKIEQKDNTLSISGSPGEYKALLTRKNSSNIPPKIYTDGINFLVTEGEYNNEYSLDIIITKKESEESNSKETYEDNNYLKEPNIPSTVINTTPNTILSNNQNNEDLITIAKNDNDIKVILPDTLCI